MFFQQYWAFFFCRGLVGIGEASYSTVSSTIIADLFVGDKRTHMLALFYFAIPVGRWEIISYLVSIVLALVCM